MKTAASWRWILVAALALTTAAPAQAQKNPLPDLVTDIICSPACGSTVAEGSDVTFSISVKNVGKAATPGKTSIEVQITFRSGGNETKTVPGPLLPGQKSGPIVIKRKVPKASVEDCNATANPNRAIAESDPNNNGFKCQVAIKSAGGGAGNATAAGTKQTVGKTVLAKPVEPSPVLKPASASGTVQRLDKATAGKQLKPAGQ